MTTKAGWTIGGGIEARLIGNLTGKIEYLYMDFGKVSTNATNAQNSTPIAFSSNSRITDNIIRVGLNYKLDPATAIGYAPALLNAPAVYKAPIYKAPIRAAWTWAGAYLGFNGGYGIGKSDTGTSFIDAASGNPLLATETSSKLRGGTFGAQAGYNWTAGPWLAGIESDLQYSDQRAKLTSVCPGAICNPALIGMIADPSVIATFEDGQKLEWFATLRARLGAIVTPDALVYATGGLAVGEIMTAGTIFGFGPGVDEAGNPAINPFNAILDNHKTKAGWALGGGIETRLGGNWTGKIEYLHLDFGTVSTAASNLLNSTPVAVFFNSRITDRIVRAGVNYKFD